MIRPSATSMRAATVTMVAALAWRRPNLRKAVRPLCLGICISVTSSSGFQLAAVGHERIEIDHALRWSALDLDLGIQGQQGDAKIAIRRLVEQDCRRQWPYCALPNRRWTGPPLAGWDSWSVLPSGVMVAAAPMTAAAVDATPGPCPRGAGP